MLLTAQKYKLTILLFKKKKKQVMNSPIAQTLLHAHDNRPPQRQAAPGSEESCLCISYSWCHGTASLTPCSYIIHTAIK